MSDKKNSNAGLKPKDRKTSLAEYTVVDPSLVVFDSIQRPITVCYFGCIREEQDDPVRKKKDGTPQKKMVTVKKASDFEKEFRNRYKTPQEAEEAIKAKIAKKVTFDFDGVWLDEIVSLNLTQTTVFKQWYNSEHVIRDLKTIENLSPEITVKVRDILDAKKSGKGAYDKRLIQYQASLLELTPRLMKGEIEAKDIPQIEERLSKEFEIKETDRQKFAA